MAIHSFAYGFYLTLRKAGFDITINDFKLVTEALHKGLGMSSGADFLFTCQLLLAKNKEEQVIIAQHFEVYRFISEHSPQDEIPGDTNPAKVAPTDKADQAKKQPDSNEKRVPNTNVDDWFNYIGDAPTIAYYPENLLFIQGGKLISTERQEPEDDYIHSPYIVGHDFLPMTVRQMQQSWRKLRSYTRSNEAQEAVNWQETIQDIAKKGFFTKPVYYRFRSNQVQLIILIDHRGSMIPHKVLGQELVKAAIGLGGHKNALVFYTTNIPKKYVYDTPQYNKAITIEHVLQQCSVNRTAFLIYSDGGASRGLYNASRIDATIKLLQRIKQHSNSIAWLNPMPKERWAGTSAARIAEYVPMFECVDIGLNAAIKTLNIGD